MIDSAHTEFVRFDMQCDLGVKITMALESLSCPCSCQIDN